MLLVTLLSLRTRALESRQRKVCDLVTRFVWGRRRGHWVLLSNLEPALRTLRLRYGKDILSSRSTVWLCHCLPHAGLVPPALGNLSDPES